MQKTIMGFLALCAMTGCSAGQDVSAAENGVVSFHQQLNAGQFGLIYWSAAKEMRTNTTEASMDQLLGAIQRKLGPFQSGKSIGWNDNVNTSGHFVTLNYASTYARGAATETFIYRLDGEHAVLVGYNINSTAMIVN